MQIVWVYGAPMAVPPVPVTFVTAVVSATGPVTTASTVNQSNSVNTISEMSNSTASVNTNSEMSNATASNVNSEMSTASNVEAGLSAAADIVQNIESPLHIDVTPPASTLSLTGMPVLTPVDSDDRKLTTPPPPSTPEPADTSADPELSTSIPVEVIPTPTFLPKNCEVTVNPAPKNFYDSLHKDDGQDPEDDDDEECQIIEAPPPSKKSHLVSLKHEVSLIAARLYQVVEELEEIQNQL